MEIIKNPKDIQISESAILLFTYFNENNEMCHKAIHIDGTLMNDNPTLAEISERYKNEFDCFMLICEEPLHGDIYRYNNNGKGEWIKIGETCGYA